MAESSTRHYCTALNWIGYRYIIGLIQPSLSTRTRCELRWKSSSQRNNTFGWDFLTVTFVKAAGMRNSCTGTTKTSLEREQALETWQKYGKGPTAVMSPFTVCRVEKGYSSRTHPRHHDVPFGSRRKKQDRQSLIIILPLGAFTALYNMMSFSENVWPFSPSTNHYQTWHHTSRTTVSRHKKYE